MNKPQKNPHRIEKMSSHIQQELGPILQEHLQGEQGMATISRVEVSKDYKWAKVWVSVLGGDDDRIFKRIHAEIYDIQGALNRTFLTKIVPRLQFYLDTTPRYAQHIDDLIKKIHEEEEQNS